MIKKISPHNNKQDIEIAKLQQSLQDFRSEFARFIANDFLHLRKEVDWIVRSIFIGFSFTILLFLLTHFF